MRAWAFDPDGFVGGLRVHLEELPFGAVYFHMGELAFPDGGTQGVPLPKIAVKLAFKEAESLGGVYSEGADLEIAGFFLPYKVIFIVEVKRDSPVYFELLGSRPVRKKDLRPRGGVKDRLDAAFLVDRFLGFPSEDRSGNGRRYCGNGRRYCGCRAKSGIR